MKSPLSVLLIICLVSSTLPAEAQDSVATGSRYSDARLVTAEGRERLDEVKGVLVSDPQARHIRFEVNNRSVFDVSYDQVTAMHYEESKYSKRLLRRPGYFLTVHYSDAAGQEKFETLRLSKGDVSSALAALEANAGLQIDRSASRRSLLGLPIYVAVGDTVYVTDETGHRVKGTLTQLSRSSLRLEPESKDRSVRERDFDQASIRKIELANLRLANHATFTTAGVLGGVCLGIWRAFYVAFGSSGTNPFVPLLWIPIAGGLLGFAVDRQSTVDVYQAP
jgi:hypothetical protein